MQSKATTVAQYIKQLPEDRRKAIEAVRAIILKNMDPDFQETMAYGMIGYNVSHKIYPNGYHCDPKQPLPFAGLASQKNHMSLYLCAAYGDAAIEEWLRKEFEKAGKKLDMGKCCIRFKKVEDLPLTVIAEAFKKVSVVEFIAGYEKFLSEHRASKTITKATTKTANKKAAKPSVKTSKSATKVAAQKTDVKTVSKIAEKASPKAATKTASSKVAKTAKKSATKTATKTAVKKSSEPAAAKPTKKSARAKAAKK